MEILDDPGREFVASPFLRLEVLPQAVFNRRTAEQAFYEAFFSAVSIWATDLPKVTEAALREASSCGVEAMDALHVAAAASMGAVELVTTEKTLPLDSPRACGEGPDDSSRRSPVVSIQLK